MEENFMSREEIMLVLTVGKLLEKSWSIPTIERAYQDAEKTLAQYERNQAKPRPPRQD
jgi:hypothetical protein